MPKKVGALINRLVQLARGKELALYRQKVRFEHAWTRQMYIQRNPLPPTQNDKFKQISIQKYQRKESTE